MALSGHVVGLLKEYMRDLVEQAKQEMATHASFGFSATPYRSDQALSDLLAILDDRCRGVAQNAADSQDIHAPRPPAGARSRGRGQ